MIMAAKQVGYKREAGTHSVTTSQIRQRLFQLCHFWDEIGQTCLCILEHLVGIIQGTSLWLNLTEDLVELAHIYHPGAQACCSPRLWSNEVRIKIWNTCYTLCAMQVWAGFMFWNEAVSLTFVFEVDFQGCEDVGVDVFFVIVDKWVKELVHFGHHNLYLSPRPANSFKLKPTKKYLSFGILPFCPSMRTITAPVTNSTAGGGDPKDLSSVRLACQSNGDHCS